MTTALRSNQTTDLSVPAEEVAAELQRVLAEKFELGVTVTGKVS